MIVMIPAFLVPCYQALPGQVRVVICQVVYLVSILIKAWVTSISIEGGIIKFSMCLVKPQTWSWEIISDHCLYDFSFVF